MNPLLERYEAWKIEGGCAEGCELLGEMSNELTRLGTMAAAALAFTSIWHEAHVVSDIACRLTRTEVDALADIFVVMGYTEDATVLLECWIEAEIEDRECVEGDFIVSDFELIDTREPE